jgi:hypothetical protein
MIPQSLDSPVFDGVHLASMPPTVALAPVQPTDGDGRVGAALSHIGGKSPRRMAVILKIIWRRI